MFTSESSKFYELNIIKAEHASGPYEKRKIVENSEYFRQTHRVSKTCDARITGY